MHAPAPCDDVRRGPTVRRRSWLRPVDRPDAVLARPRGVSCACATRSARRRRGPEARGGPPRRGLQAAQRAASLASAQPRRPARGSGRRRRPRHWPRPRPKRVAARRSGSSTARPATSRASAAAAAAPQSNPRPTASRQPCPRAGARDAGQPHDPLAEAQRLAIHHPHRLRVGAPDLLSRGAEPNRSTAGPRRDTTGAAIAAAAEGPPHGRGRVERPLKMRRAASMRRIVKPSARRLQPPAAMKLPLQRPMTAGDGSRNPANRLSRKILAAEALPAPRGVAAMAGDAGLAPALHARPPPRPARRCARPAPPPARAPRRRRWRGRAPPAAPPGASGSAAPPCRPKSGAKSSAA